MLNENFVLVGILLQVLTGIGYFLDTVKGKVKPNRVSWFLWSLAPMIAFFAEIKEGVGIQSLMTFTVGFIPLLIVAASFINKKSYWQLSKFDFICGSLSLLGLALWFITKTGTIAILFSILADGLASIPTVMKAYKEPETEAALIFWAGVVLGGLTLLTIKTWTVATYAFPVYIFFINVLIASLVDFKIGKRVRVLFAKA